MNDVVVLSWAVYALAINPNVKAKVCEEVKRVCSDTKDITADSVDNMP